MLFTVYKKIPDFPENPVGKKNMKHDFSPYFSVPCPTEHLTWGAFHSTKTLAWISSDYFESLLLPPLRGENDSKQLDEFQATKTSGLNIFGNFQ